MCRYTRPFRSQLQYIHFIYYFIFICFGISSLHGHKTFFDKSDVFLENRLQVFFVVLNLQLFSLRCNWFTHILCVIPCTHSCPANVAKIKFENYNNNNEKTYYNCIRAPLRSTNARFYPFANEIVVDSSTARMNRSCSDMWAIYHWDIC